MSPPLRDLSTEDLGRRLEWGDGATDSATVATVAEMDAVLDRLTDDAVSHPIIVELMMPNGATLSMGVGGSVTVLDYVGPSVDPPYFQSSGNPVDGELVCFYRGSWSEYPPDSAVPVEAGRQVMREFFHTGELASNIDWKEA